MDIGYFSIEEGLVITHCYKCGEILKKCKCGHDCPDEPFTCKCDERDYQEEEYNRQLMREE